MKIEYYKDLEEKSNHFQTTQIDTKKELDSFINKWTKKDNSQEIIFRGLTEAKYKLYNSAQRFWIGEELDKLGKTYHQFIFEQIESAKKVHDHLLIKFYKSFGHKAYDLSILSFLQHYGAPTSLLDFTYNLDCALFFGTEKIKYDHTKDDIENYFSIYSINLRETRLFFPSIIRHITSSVDQINDILEKHKDRDIDTSPVTEPLQTLSYNHFKNLGLFFIPGYKEGGYNFKIDNLPNFQLIFNQQNLNVINQDGLFVYTSDNLHPLEDYFTGERKSFQNIYPLPKIRCWNIHKSFKEYITSRLNNLNPQINREFLFPQEEGIAASVFKKFKSEL